MGGGYAHTWPDNFCTYLVVNRLKNKKKQAEQEATLTTTPHHDHHHLHRSSCRVCSQLVLSWGRGARLLDQFLGRGDLRRRPRDADVAAVAGGSHDDLRARRLGDGRAVDAAIQGPLRDSGRPRR